MTIGGFLKSIETLAGQTIGVLRENGQVEDCFIVDPADVAGAGLGGAASALYFVDKNAAVGGTGTSNAPFNTFAAGFAAAAADAATTFRPQTIWVTPGAYAEAPQTSAVGGFQLTVVGWNIGGDISFVPDVAPSLPNISLTGAGTVLLNLVGCNIGTVAVATGEITLQTTVATSTITCDVLKALDSQLGAGAWVATTSADITNCVMGGAGGTTALATFRNCPQPAAPLVVTGAVQIDAFTNAWQSITASTTLTVINRPGRATVSVVVPAVLVGQVGYVDTVLTGELAALAADSPIVGNPTADLVAAGAGGGFVNCRVSAPGTVRSAFVGPLAGGASNFTFSAL